MSFTLQFLLAVFLVFAAALGTLGLDGLLVGLGLVAAVLFVRTRPHTTSEWLCVIAIGLILLAVILPPVEMGRSEARRISCALNLKWIDLALHSYHDQYGTLPPAYVPGPDGRPWHSWRVLLLPFIEQEDLYAQYRFDEPWDGPNNAKLAASVPQPYMCPASAGAGIGRTNYLAVVGPETAWPRERSRRLDEFPDDGARTILLLETTGRGVPWMKPKDLNYDEVIAGPRPDADAAEEGGHPVESRYFYLPAGYQVHAAMVDGSVHAIPRDVPGGALAPLLTIQGEPVDVDSLDPTCNRQLNWARILGLAAMAVATLLTWWTARPRKQTGTAAAED